MPQSALSHLSPLPRCSEFSHFNSLIRLYYSNGLSGERATRNLLLKIWSLNLVFNRKMKDFILCRRNFQHQRQTEGFLLLMQAASEALLAFFLTKEMLSVNQRLLSSRKCIFIAGIFSWVKILLKTCLLSSIPCCWQHLLCLLNKPWYLRLHL